MKMFTDLIMEEAVGMWLECYCEKWVTYRRCEMQAVFGLGLGMPSCPV